MVQVVNPRLPPSHARVQTPPASSSLPKLPVKTKIFKIYLSPNCYTTQRWNPPESPFESCSVFPDPCFESSSMPLLLPQPTIFRHAMIRVYVYAWTVTLRPSSRPSASRWRLSQPSRPPRSFDTTMVQLQVVQSNKPNGTPPLNHLVFPRMAIRSHKNLTEASSRRDASTGTRDVNSDHP